MPVSLPPPPRPREHRPQETCPPRRARSVRGPGPRTSRLTGPPPGIKSEGPRGCNSVVECKLPKLDVAGSIPVTRSLENPRRRRGFSWFWGMAGEARIQSAYGSRAELRSLGNGARFFQRVCLCQVRTINSAVGRLKRRGLSAPQGNAIARPIDGIARVGGSWVGEESLHWNRVRDCDRRNRLWSNCRRERTVPYLLQDDRVAEVHAKGHVSPALELCRKSRHL
jgi:hypothetical protein